MKHIRGGQPIKKKRKEIKGNQTSLAALKSMQHFYESFCRAGTEYEDPDFIEKTSRANSETSEKDYNTDVIDLCVTDHLSQTNGFNNETREIMSDTFVQTFEYLFGIATTNRYAHYFITH